MRNNSQSQKDSAAEEDEPTVKLQQALALVNQALEDIESGEAGHSTGVDSLQLLEVAVQRRLDELEEQ
jgi:hypothetical protein